MYTDTAQVARIAINSWCQYKKVLNEMKGPVSRIGLENAAIRRAKVNVGEAQERFGKDHSFWYVLVDYRNDNEILKKSSMRPYEAALKNNTLAGTGLAWARQSGGYD